MKCPGPQALKSYDLTLSLRINRLILTLTQLVYHESKLIYLETVTRQCELVKRNSI